MNSLNENKIELRLGSDPIKILLNENRCRNSIEGNLDLYKANLKLLAS